MYILSILWRTEGEKELSFKSELEAKRHKESMEAIFGTRIIRMEIRREQ